MSDFSGQWLTTFGPMILNQDGVNVQGSYGVRQEGVIQGAITDGRLTFTYHEPTTGGEGWFELHRYETVTQVERLE